MMVYQHMCLMLWCLFCCLFSIQVFGANNVNTSSFAFKSEPDTFVVEQAEWNETYSDVIVSGRRHVYQFKTDANVSRWIRVWISSNVRSIDKPIFVTARTAKTIRTWTIPDEYDTVLYRSVSRVLCNRGDVLQLEFVSSSTNFYNFKFSVELMEPIDFSIGKSISSVVSDLSYPLFHFIFPPGVDSVLLRTISNDSVCAVIRVEQESCKSDYFAAETRVQIVQNFMHYGTVSINRGEFADCQITVLLRHPGFCKRHRRVGFELVEKTSSDDAIFLNATKRFEILIDLRKPGFPWPILWFFLLVTIPAIATLIVCWTPRALHYLYRPINVDQISLPSSIVKSNEKVKQAYVDAREKSKIKHLLPSIHHQPPRSPDAIKCDKGHSMDMSLYGKPGSVSDSFLYNLLIVATFYSFPALQLLFQQMWFAAHSGSQEMCYFNFRCVTPIGPFCAFNNLFSNYGYVCFGVVFLVIVRVHSDYLAWRFKEIFYALGVAMILEGILSAAYHLCPNNQSFQFDTTFMYALAGLMFYHLYQIRNPSPYDHPYKLFLLYAVAVFFVGMAAIVQQQQQPWRIVLAILYGLASIAITILVIRTIFMFNELAVHHVNARRVMQTIQYTLNVGLLCVGLWAWIETPQLFSAILLFVFLGNLFIFTIFYFILKLLQKERVVWAPILAASISIALWSISLYYFNVNVSSWQETPSLSRNMNQNCILWDFYDHHDVWHLLSSMGVFTSLLFILTLDDGQTLTQQFCLACHSAQTSMHNLHNSSTHSSFFDCPDGMAQELVDDDRSLSMSIDDDPPPPGQQPTTKLKVAPLASLADL